MSILQFLRIIWAYRLLILLTTAVMFAIGTATVFLVQPQYVATSRVMLDVIKPDPVTGQVMSTSYLRAYTKTQIELVKDQQVARRVVDDLKWSEDKARQREFTQRKKHLDLDFPRWAAQDVVAGADASLIAGSNILEISYTSPSPEKAKGVADALRNAYVEMTLQSRREAARRNAEWYEAQAGKAKSVLLQAEENKSKVEKESGIVLQDDKIDIDSARLSALASQGSAPVFAAPSVGMTPSQVQLAEVDNQIAEAAKSLGPNHPSLVMAKQRRELLAKQAAQERAAAGTAAGAAVAAQRATQTMLDSQKVKVMAQRGQVERLRLMQDEIDLRRDQYNKAVVRAAQLRQELEVLEAGVVPLGSAITPQAPVFPKKGLIIGASIPGGAALGIIAALLMELFGRRVRGEADLMGAVNAPVLAVIHCPKNGPRKAWSFRLMPKAPSFRTKAARA